jgi:parallel beta-helix repeat protein
VIYGDGSSHVVTIAANDTELIGFTIENGGIGHHGVHIDYGCSRNNILKNIILNNGIGILIQGYNCSNNILHNNTISQNLGGIYVLGYYSHITQNIIEDNTGVGIHGEGCHNSIMEENIISNSIYGMGLWNANGSNINGNVISNCTTHGICLRNSNCNTVVDNDVRASDSQSDGVLLEYSNNNTVTGNILITKFNNGVRLTASDYNNIISNKVLGSKFGIALINSSNNTAANNNIYSGNEWGIYLSCSNDNKIGDNNSIRLNQNGLFLNFSSRNTIISNSIGSNTRFGARIEYSENNTLVSNNFTGNKYNFGVCGSQLSHFNHSVDNSNKVGNDGDIKQIYYLKNQENRVINSSELEKVGYLALINSTAITVKGQKSIELTKNLQGLLLVATENSVIDTMRFHDNSYGIYMLWSNNNTVIRCSIKGNEAYGVYLSSSHNITLVGNGIVYNECGIYLRSSCNNNITYNNIQYKEHGTTAVYIESSNSSIIYSNNFFTSNINIDDSSNSWNYSTLGNYWYSHNYTGTPKEINENNTDHHPLEYPLLSALTGDVDWDGDVDIYDIVKITGVYRSKRGDSSWNPYVDLDQDGEIKIYDVVRATSHYGSEWDC